MHVEGVKCKCPVRQGRFDGVEGKCLSLTHAFGCFEKCCSHNIVLNQDVDKICMSHVSPSLTGNVAPELHPPRHKRSKQPPSCKGATGLSAPVVHPPLDDEGDANDADNDDEYKHDDINRDQRPMKQPPFRSVLIDPQTRFDGPIDQLSVPPFAPAF